MRLVYTQEPALTLLKIASAPSYMFWLQEEGFFSSFFLRNFFYLFIFFSPVAADHWLFVAVFSLLSLRVCSVGSGP